jgi:hypothetical protein
METTSRPSREKPLRLLFLCTGNSAWSQIGEAILARKGGARFVVASAGSQPAARVNPLTVTRTSARIASLPVPMTCTRTESPVSGRCRTPHRAAGGSHRRARADRGIHHRRHYAANGTPRADALSAAGSVPPRCLPMGGTRVGHPCLRRSGRSAREPSLKRSSSRRSDSSMRAHRCFVA